MRLKWIAGCMTFLIAGIVGYQAFAIARLGVSAQIPQLEGDGGGGFCFAVLSLAAAACLVLWRRGVFALLTAAAALEGILVGYVYLDNWMFVWSAMVIAVAGFYFVLTKFAETKGRQPLRSR